MFIITIMHQELEYYRFTKRLNKGCKNEQNR